MNQQEPTHVNDMKGKGGITRIINAAHYSKDGLHAAWQNEAAFRQLVWLNGILLILVWCLDLGNNTRMILITASFLSLIVELFNTGIEAIVDYISLEKHPLAKRAKDVGSAAQLLAMILLTILWGIALF
ncbi:MAG: diacylglycerol kinase [Alysiella sp.]|uniref:diacylglycerol kinase n=1 Tax=Alysiella sp. TaxID=1872483 RepID=UPI0026DA9508|nr:diacylglycerol kinase [Alysiella sp.]MDO4433387.1 diacylglycerol kinase [Alysiella sp.]